MAWLRLALRCESGVWVLSNLAPRSQLLVGVGAASFVPMDRIHGHRPTSQPSSHTASIPVDMNLSEQVRVYGTLPSLLPNDFESDSLLFPVHPSLQQSPTTPQQAASLGIDDVDDDFLHISQNGELQATAATNSNSTFSPGLATSAPSAFGFPMADEEHHSLRHAAQAPAAADTAIVHSAKHAAAVAYGSFDEQSYRDVNTQSWVSYPQQIATASTTTEATDAARTATTDGMHDGAAAASYDQQQSAAGYDSTHAPQNADAATYAAPHTEHVDASTVSSEQKQPTEQQVVVEAEPPDESDFEVKSPQEE